jgi:hypothetical protein
MGGEGRMGRLRILSKLGDRTVRWDEHSAASGDPEAQEAVRQAERIFERERARGATAYRVSPGSTAQRIDEFDARAEQIVIVPRMAGG